MKEFIEPEIKVEKFSLEDVITISNVLEENNSTSYDGTKLDVTYDPF